jgi:osmotically-inducible protein OsmY
MQRMQRDDWEDSQRRERGREDARAHEGRRGPHRAGRDEDEEFESANFGREDTGREDYGRERRRGSYRAATESGSFDAESQQGGRRGQRFGGQPGWQQPQQGSRSGWYGSEGASSRRGSFEDSEPLFSYTEVWLIEGPHTGRGPKGFQRSNERLREQVCERLERHGQVDASDIDVQVEDGVVTLEGSVDDRRTKRLAEECAETVPGVRDVMNRLRVDQGFFQRMLGLGRSDEEEETKQGASPSRKSQRG